MNKECLICGKLFEKKKYLSKKNWFKVKFCSIQCRTRGQKGKNLGIRFGIEFKKGVKRPDISGDKHYRWNNGQFRRNGYVFLYKPNHPNTNCNGYVREHRLVMEKHLGRYLELQEVVHHINEIKDDNRLENLMLLPNSSAHRLYHIQHKK